MAAAPPPSPAHGLAPPAVSHVAYADALKYFVGAPQPEGGMLALCDPAPEAFRAFFLTADGTAIDPARSSLGGLCRKYAASGGRRSDPSARRKMSSYAAFGGADSAETLARMRAEGAPLAYDDANVHVQLLFALAMESVSECLAEAARARPRDVATLRAANAGCVALVSAIQEGAVRKLLELGRTAAEAEGIVWSDLCSPYLAIREGFGYIQEFLYNGVQDGLLVNNIDDPDGIFHMPLHDDRDGTTKSPGADRAYLYGDGREPVDRVVDPANPPNFMACAFGLLLGWSAASRRSRGVIRVVPVLGLIEHMLIRAGQPYGSPFNIEVTTGSHRLAADIEPSPQVAGLCLRYHTMAGAGSTPATCWSYARQPDLRIARGQRFFLYELGYGGPKDMGGVRPRGEGRGVLYKGGCKQVVIGFPSDNAMDYNTKDSDVFEAVRRFHARFSRTGLKLPQPPGRQQA